MKPCMTLTANQLMINQSNKILKSADYQLWLDSQDIITAARKQAEQIIEKSKQAYEDEKKRGYEEGVALSKVDQAEQMLKVVSRTIDYLSGVESVLAEILMSGVKKIIGDFDQETLTVNLVKSALEHVRSEKEVTIRIPPSQYQMLKSKVNDILAEYKGVGFINLVSDQRLSTGDCIMESAIGVVDASVDVQLEALERRFSRLQSTAVSSIAQETLLLDDVE